MLVSGGCSVSLGKEALLGTDRQVLQPEAPSEIRNLLPALSPA